VVIHHTTHDDESVGSISGQAYPTKLNFHFRVHSPVDGVAALLLIFIDVEQGLRADGVKLGRGGVRALGKVLLPVGPGRDTLLPTS